jgi:hypothetical protein
MAARSCAGVSDKPDLGCYHEVAINRAQSIGSFLPDFAASPSFEELAAQQGVTPVGDFDTLLGAPTPGDESLEEFSASLRGWRRESSANRIPPDLSGNR